MKSKASIRSINLDTNGEWVVKFSVPKTEVEIGELSIKISAIRRPDRGPDETKSLEEVISEARLTLANALWPILRSAIDGAGKDGVWEQFISIAQSAADDAAHPSDRDDAKPSPE